MSSSCKISHEAATRDHSLLLSFPPRGPSQAGVVESMETTPEAPQFASAEPNTRTSDPLFLRSRPSSQEYTRVHPSASSSSSSTMTKRSTSSSFVVPDLNISYLTSPEQYPSPSHSPLSELRKVHEDMSSTLASLPLPNWNILEDAATQAKSRASEAVAEANQAHLLAEKAFETAQLNLAASTARRNAAQASLDSASAMVASLVAARSQSSMEKSKQQLGDGIRQMSEWIDKMEQPEDPEEEQRRAAEIYRMLKSAQSSRFRLSPLLPPSRPSLPEHTESLPTTSHSMNASNSQPIIQDATSSSTANPPESRERASLRPLFLPSQSQDAVVSGAPSSFPSASDTQGSGNLPCNQYSQEPCTVSFNQSARSSSDQIRTESMPPIAHFPPQSTSPSTPTSTLSDTKVDSNGMDSGNILVLRNLPSISPQVSQVNQRHILDDLPSAPDSLTKVKKESGLSDDVWIHKPDVDLPGLSTEPLSHSSSTTISHSAPTPPFLQQRSSLPLQADSSTLDKPSNEPPSTLVSKPSIPPAHSKECVPTPMEISTCRPLAQDGVERTGESSSIIGPPNRGVGERPGNSSRHSSSHSIPAEPKPTPISTPPQNSYSTAPTVSEGSNGSSALASDNNRRPSTGSSSQPRLMSHNSGKNPVRSRPRIPSNTQRRLPSGIVDHWSPPSRPSRPTRPLSPPLHGPSKLRHDAYVPRRSRSPPLASLIVEPQPTYDSYRRSQKRPREDDMNDLPSAHRDPRHIREPIPLSDSSSGDQWSNPVPPPLSPPLIPGSGRSPAVSESGNAGAFREHPPLLERMGLSSSLTSFFPELAENKQIPNATAARPALKMVPVAVNSRNKHYGKGDGGQEPRSLQSRLNSPIPQRDLGARLS